MSKTVGGSTVLLSRPGPLRDGAEHRPTSITVRLANILFMYYDPSHYCFYTFSLTID